MKDIINTNNANEADELLKIFLNDILKVSMSAISADCGSLFLFDSGKEELVLNSFYNSGSLNLLGLRMKRGEGIAGKVADIREPILVKDIRTDSRFRCNGFSHYRTNSFISVPLFTSKGLFGLINLADKSSGEPFSEKDLQAVITIVKYACLAMDSVSSCLGLKQEKEILHKQKSLLEKYASVGKLAAGVVHEINNPLDGVIRYANIMLEQVENNSIAREYLLEVKKGLNRIANITRSLLEFSHQVNSVSPHAKKYVDITELIDDSLDVLREKVKGRIKIEKKYKQSLPRILDLGLSHIVINMIKNALDAIPQEGTLEISTDVKDSTVEISFKDSGTGIPQEIKDRIFEPFFTTKSVNNGTGLGLSICNEIITKYKGKIEVESIPGEGSTFRILIPKNYLENA